MATPGAAPTKSRIFISYRREDAEYPVGRLAEDLCKHFPRDQVFQDIASIDPGADFVEALQQALDTCAAVLVVIGPRWLTAADHHGRRRLDLPDDWVRHEIVESLRRPGVRVFPVLLDAEMPTAEELPEPLRPLTRRQAFPLTGRHWAKDVAELAEFLKRVPGLAAPPAAETKVPQARPASESVEPPARAATIARPPAGITAEVQRPKKDETLRAGSAPGVVETEKRPGGVKPAPEIVVGPRGKTGAKVPWKLVAAVGAAMAIALFVFFTRGERPRAPAPTPTTKVETPAAKPAIKQPEPAVEPETAVARTPQHELTPRPTDKTPPAKPAIEKPEPAAEPVTTALKTGETFRDCDQCPQMVGILAGRFLMGSPATDMDRWADEIPQHEARIGRAFAIGRFEVTFNEWDACVAAGGCRHRPDDNGWGRGKRPVIDVSWDDARAYIAWLSQKTGRRYRLPSEVEWEYAARAGATARYPWGDDPSSNRANFRESGSQWSGTQTAPVGSFGSNGYALYDMIGNVSEWVQDCWNEDYRRAPADGSAWEAGECGRRVVRGGAWTSNPRGARTATRRGDGLGHRNSDLGFRVARDL
jgi:formylglycine-generating enzyme required for sulfatase activity